MTNEETLSALILMRDNCVNKREYDDPMREIKQRALEAAIKAIDNQERMQRELKSLDGIADTCDKLERALNMIACQIIDFAKERDCAGCPLKGSGIEKWGSSCKQKIVEYYKRKAGID